MSDDSRVKRLPGMALHLPGIGVPDLPPPFEYALDSHPRLMRTFEPYIAAGFTDAEAWDALFDDEQRLRTFKLIHGNRKGKKRKTPSPTLF